MAAFYKHRQQKNAVEILPLLKKYRVRPIKISKNIKANLIKLLQSYETEYFFEYEDIYEYAKAFSSEIKNLNGQEMIEYLEARIHLLENAAQHRDKEFKERITILNAQTAEIYGKMSEYISNWQNQRYLDDYWGDDE